MKDRHEQTRRERGGSDVWGRSERRRDQHSFDRRYHQRTDSRGRVTDEVTYRCDVFGNRISMKLHVPRKKWERPVQVRAPRIVVAAPPDAVQEPGSPQSPTYSPLRTNLSDAPGCGGEEPTDRPAEHHDPWGGFKPRKNKSRGSRRRYFCPSVDVHCWLMGKLGDVLFHVNKERHGVGGRTYTEDDQELLKEKPVRRGSQHS